MSAESRRPRKAGEKEERLEGMGIQLDTHLCSRFGATYLSEAQRGEQKLTRPHRIQTTPVPVSALLRG